MALQDTSKNSMTAVTSLSTLFSALTESQHFTRTVTQLLGMPTMLAARKSSAPSSIWTTNQCYSPMAALAPGGLLMRTATWWSGSALASTVSQQFIKMALQDTSRNSMTSVTSLSTLFLALTENRHFTRTVTQLLGMPTMLAVT